MPRRPSALALQFASTNLVVELGIVLWLLIGWQFTLAEYIGGLVLVALTTLLLRMFVSRSLEERARATRGRAPRRVPGPGVQFLLAVVPAALRAGTRAICRTGARAQRGTRCQAFALSAHPDVRAHCCKSA